MQAQPIRHVGHLALGIPSLGRLRQPPFHPWKSRDSEAPLNQVAFEDFHQAMGVGVVMDGALHPGRPDEQEQVEEARDLTHEIARVLL